jgi:methyl-accepting chemotaxis protein
LQQNAAMVEESAAASENLKEQARNLTDIVSNFRLSRTEPGYSKRVNANGAATQAPQSLSNTPRLLANRS